MESMYINYTIYVNLNILFLFVLTIIKYLTTWLGRWSSSEGAPIFQLPRGRLVRHCRVIAVHVRREWHRAIIAIRIRVRKKCKLRNKYTIIYDHQKYIRTVAETHHFVRGTITTMAERRWRPTFGHYNTRINT